MVEEICSLTVSTELPLNKQSPARLQGSQSYPLKEHHYLPTEGANDM